MTLDQFIALLGALAWPLVALIAGVALVHAARLGFEAADSVARRIAETIHKVSHDATFDTSRRLDLLANVVQVSLPATIRAVANDSHAARQAVGHGPDPATRMAERAMELLLQTNGGFPAAHGDKVGRQLVREIREMYAELRTPTAGPANAPSASGEVVDDLTLDEPELEDGAGGRWGDGWDADDARAESDRMGELE
jgi:hypothetical protein